MVKDKLAEFIRNSENYHLTLIHAEDDSDITFTHTQQLFWHAVNASSTTPISFVKLEEYKERSKVDLGPGGWYADWVTQKGEIRLQILRYGAHDWQMTYPATALAVVRAFRSREPQYGV
jgi:abhydrolase domain-containing protein 12